jgi:transcriptional regulator with XRE-family HTH domain
MIEYRSKLGYRISELRKKMGFTQEQLSEYADLSQNFLSQLENGKKNISIETLLKISNALEIKPAYFLDVGNMKHAIKIPSLDKRIQVMVSSLPSRDKRILFSTLKEISKARKRR